MRRKKERKNTRKTPHLKVRNMPCAKCVWSPCWMAQHEHEAHVSWHQKRMEQMLLYGTISLWRKCCDTIIMCRWPVQDACDTNERRAGVLRRLHWRQRQGLSPVLRQLSSRLPSGRSLPTNPNLRACWELGPSQPLHPLHPAALWRWVSSLSSVLLSLLPRCDATDAEITVHSTENYQGLSLDISCFRFYLIKPG